MKTLQISQHHQNFTHRGGRGEKSFQQSFRKRILVYITVVGRRNRLLDGGECLSSFCFALHSQSNSSRLSIFMIFLPITLIADDDDGGEDALISISLSLLISKIHLQRDEEQQRSRQSGAEGKIDEIN
jgi:hypothetical protein